jgi:hypothetical protein
MNRKPFGIVLLFCFSISVLPAIAQIPSTIIAKSGSTPTIDGLVGSSEWSDASTVSFNGTQVFLKQDGQNLYIAFKAPIYPASVMNVAFDVNNDRGLIPQSDDITLGIDNSNTLGEAHVVNNQWDRVPVSGWTGQSQTASNIIQAEFSIPYAKLNIVAGSNKTLGINFAYLTSSNPPTPGTVFWWLNTANLAQPELNPSAWGVMSSTGYSWVPEFSSLLALSLLMVTMLFLTIVYRHSHGKKPSLMR